MNYFYKKSRWYVVSYKLSECFMHYTFIYLYLMIAFNRIYRSIRKVVHPI